MLRNSSETARDYATGVKESEFRRGQSPDASTHALQINHPSLVREQ